ncbi:hypothetical protein [Sphingomonas bacterium]|uniref:hypothetical protein n=1 Tax=Sphingomonas bacterium TaxID=1895847 RepID=UPI0015764A2A|nr:hypothetical protein [Sphingomonas bacterium]
MAQNAIHFGETLVKASIFGAMSLGLAGPACSETRTYTYNARGALTASSVAGGPANGVQASTTYDPAGNRTAYQTSGSSAAPTYKTVIVVPINGLTPIIIPQ